MPLAAAALLMFAAQALESLQRACDLNPGDAGACYALGRALLTQGRYREAREPLEKALRAAPRDLHATIHRALALNFIGLLLPAEAERHFREAVGLTTGPTRPADDPRIDFGAFLVREGRAEEAVRLLAPAAATHPGSSRAHAELGKALLYAGQVSKAAASLEKAVALDPEAWPTHLLLGRAYLQLGRTADAERELALGKKGWTDQDTRSGSRD